MFIRLYDCDLHDLSFGRLIGHDDVPSTRDRPVPLAADECGGKRGPPLQQ
jgi:hypothetical protein